MKLIFEYLQSGECFIYKDGSVILGCYVLKEINIDKVELVNIAVSENKQSHGIGKNYYYICLIMQNKGYKEIIVGTGNSSIDQIAFIKKVFQND